MSQLVLLNLGKGSWQNGFPNIIAQVGQTGAPLTLKITGSLPPALELWELYRRWQLLYAALADGVLWRRGQPSIEIDDHSITHVSEAEFDSLCKQLKRQINLWLDSNSFGKIERRLRTKLAPEDEIRVVVETEDEQVRRLPWHLWSFFQDYPNAEVALSIQEYQQVKPLPPTEREKVKILAILGNSNGIDIDADQRLLEALPETELVFLKEPQRQALDEALWDGEGWNILFFAGHSHSDNNTGCIQLNQQDSLTVTQVKNALTQAIDRGLQLAIFNSCDGLGLARQLADLCIPQIIVMREPVSDRVAQTFLKHFLTAFAGGQSFYCAVREARERLQGLEGEFSGASWLPVICQNPAEIPPTWAQLQGQNEPIVPQPDPPPQPPSPPSIRAISRRLLAVSLSATALVMGLRCLGMLEAYELQAFDRLMGQRPTETPDDRLLIIRATPEDLKNQTVEPKHGASLADGTLALVLEKLKSYQPSAIGLDIYRDFPVDPATPELAASLMQEHLFGICKARDPKGGDGEGVAPSPDIHPDRLTFSDAIADADAILRRHLLSLKSEDPTDPCTAKNNLSFLLSLYYLETVHGIAWDYTPKGQVQFETPEGKTVVLEALQPYSGGYHGLDAGGRQLLLNYRALPSPEEIAKTLSIRDLLDDRVPLDRLLELQGRIVLIGVAGPINTSSDYWRTPYSATQPLHRHFTAGIFIQAHMVSQIISAVLDDRPLIWVLPEGGELLWIWGWSVVGGMVVLVLRWQRWMHFPLLLGLSTGLALGGLYGICYVCILQGGWLPLVPGAIVLVLSAVGMTWRSSGDFLGDR